MTYKSFEALPVWQEAAELYDRTDEFLEHAPPRMRSAFRNQLERAALSVSNIIAEGFERGTTNELLQFIYIARGSADEVRSMLCLAQRRPWAKPFDRVLTDLKSSASCARELRGWAESLQNSEIRVQRHLTKAVRQRFEDKQRAMACEKRSL